MNFSANVDVKQNKKGKWWTIVDSGLVYELLPKDGIYIVG